VADSAIQWCDKVWNPVRGCRRVSPGCEHCYAERQAHRFSGAGQPYEGLTKLTKRGPVWTGEARFVPEMLAAPLSWKKPARIFVNSMSDLFHEDVTNEQIAAVFGVMWACPQHTFQVLTKRPERAVRWFESMRWAHGNSPLTGPSRMRVDPLTSCQILAGRLVKLGAYNLGERPQIWPLPNVWLGVSVEDQQRADERIPPLLRCPAAVRFVSAEPLLGPVDLSCVALPESWRVEDDIADCIDALRYDPAHIDWVIAGGESGPGARPCCLSWLRNIVHDCDEASVPCFVKQLGAKPYEARDDAPDDEGRWEPEAWLNLDDKKGGDPAEWVAFGESYLNVRQFPEVRHG